MDAANQSPNYVEVRPVENCNRRNREEEAEMNEALPRPVGMGIEEISERDFEVLCQAAKSTPSVVSRLKREPRRMPQREAVSSAN